MYASNDAFCTDRKEKSLRNQLQTKLSLSYLKKKKTLKAYSDCAL